MDILKKAGLTALLGFNFIASPLYAVQFGKAEISGNLDPHDGESIYYFLEKPITVEYGDNLSNVALKLSKDLGFLVTDDELHKINFDVIGCNKNRLRPGQELTFEYCELMRNPERNERIYQLVGQRRFNPIHSSGAGVIVTY